MEQESRVEGGNVGSQESRQKKKGKLRERQAEEEKWYM